MSRRACRIARAGLALAACLLALATACPARAGPPYVTDDPEPTRTGGWENYVFVSGTDTPGASAGQAGIELNYGAAANLQLSLTLPADYIAARGLRAGAGDFDAGIKYRLLHPPAGSWLPDAALFPALTVPTDARGFSTGHAAAFVPLWLEKDFGRWSLFGGGGYDLNPGAGQKDYGLAGCALTRSFGDRLSLGLEAYHQTPATAGGSGATNIGLGTIYQVSRHWALMASGGPGLQSRSSAFYFSLQYTD